MKAKSKKKIMIVAPVFIVIVLIAVVLLSRSPITGNNNNNPTPTPLFNDNEFSGVLNPADGYAVSLTIPERFYWQSSITISVSAGDGANVQPLRFVIAHGATTLDYATLSNGKSATLTVDNPETGGQDYRVFVEYANFENFDAATFPTVAYHITIS